MNDKINEAVMTKQTPEENEENRIRNLIIPKKLRKQIEAKERAMIAAAQGK